MYLISYFSLLIRFTDDKFDPNEQPTIGVDFKVKHMEIDGERIYLQIWDTGKLCLSGSIHLKCYCLTPPRQIPDFVIVLKFRFLPWITQHIKRICIKSIFTKKSINIC